ncbi:Fur family transcriptional regulator, zinc uptake regulator [Franzmannia pantelleriensis]|uniref:Fur family transcriptional regulator, zinc uptake regulator n=1 Tax=Franzmannia pantelleriensis TaxID=48727 RepID=A0A1G9PBM6_9GAMM|nr:Fur family transcriptional regulator [Halomonas pantelleriensis]SDL96158.1 Fur family transcriptional regulator, zinc uptake regulator [Halomonas pantelleriensis]
MPLTANQQRVLEVLRSAEAPLGAYALLERLSGHGFSAPTQVYRALDVLIRHGLAHRLETLNAYVACRLKECRQGVTVFAICDDCGNIDELIDNALNSSLGHLVERRDFSPGSTTIEIHGTCSQCAAALPESTRPSKVKS